MCVHAFVFVSGCYMNYDHIIIVQDMLSYSTQLHVCSIIDKEWLLLDLRPNYIHSASNDIHTDGPRARARYSENLLTQHIS